MGFPLWAMLKWFMAVSYVVEEVDLILPSKEGRANTVNWGISPTLKPLASVATNSMYWDKPHNKIRPFHLGNQKIWSTLRLSTGQGRRSQNYSKLRRSS